MGEIEVRLKKSYVNEFLTTVTGYIIRHETWTTVNDNDTEIRQLLNQGQILEAKGRESLKEKIIMDSPPKDTLKGTITTKSLEDNERTIDKLKEGENNMTDENPAPEEQPKEPTAMQPETPDNPAPAPEPQPEAPAEEPEAEAEAPAEEAPAEEPKAEEEPKADDNPEPTPNQD